MTHTCFSCGGALTDREYCLRCGTLHHEARVERHGRGHPPETTTELVGEGPVLFVTCGRSAGSGFPLRDVAVVGRDADLDVVLDDITVSRRHAVLAQGDGGYTVRDLDSLNGTYLDGERVTSAALHDGSQIRVGRFCLLFRA